MQVTNVQLRKSTKPGIVKAFGRATLEDKLVLDVLVMDNGTGAWATFPNGKKGTDGKFYLPVFFKEKEDNEAFKAKVLEAFDGLGDSTPVTQPEGTPAGSESLPF